MSGDQVTSQPSQSQDEFDEVDELASLLVNLEPADKCLTSGVSIQSTTLSAGEERCVYKTLAAAIIAEDDEVLRKTLKMHSANPYGLQTVMELLLKDLAALRIKLTYRIDYSHANADVSSCESSPVGYLTVETEDGNRKVYSTGPSCEGMDDTNSFDSLQAPTKPNSDRQNVKFAGERLSEESAEATGATAETESQITGSDAQSDESPTKIERPLAGAQEVQQLLTVLSNTMLSERKITGYLNKGSVTESNLEGGGKELIARDEGGGETFVLRTDRDGTPFHFRCRNCSDFVKCSEDHVWSSDNKLHELSVSFDHTDDLGRLVVSDLSGQETTIYYTDGTVRVESQINKTVSIKTPDGNDVLTHTGADGGRRVTAVDRIGRVSHFVWFTADGVPLFYRDRDGDWTTGDAGKTWINSQGMTREESIFVDERGNLLLRSEDGVRQWTLTADGTEHFLNKTAGYLRITFADGYSVWEEPCNQGELEVTARSKTAKVLYKVRFNSKRSPCSYEDKDGFWICAADGTSWTNERGETREQRVFVDKWGNLIQISLDCMRSWTTTPDGTLIHRNREVGYQQTIKSDGSSLFEEMSEAGQRCVTAYDTTQKKLYTIRYDGQHNVSSVENKGEHWHRSSSNVWQSVADNSELAGGFYTEGTGNLVKFTETEQYTYTLQGDIVSEVVGTGIKLIAKSDGSSVRIKVTEDCGQEVEGYDTSGKETYRVILGPDGKAQKTKDRNGCWSRVSDNSWTRDHDGKPWIGLVEIDSRGNYIETTTGGQRCIAPSGTVVVNQNKRKSPRKRSNSGKPRGLSGDHTDDKLESSSDLTDIAVRNRLEAPSDNKSARDGVLVAAPGEVTHASKTIQNESGLSITYDELGRIASVREDLGNSRQFTYEGVVLIGCTDRDINGNEVKSSNFLSYQRVQINSANGDMIIVLDESSTCISKLDGSEAWLQHGQMNMFKRPDGSCRWFHYVDGHLIGFDGRNADQEDVCMNDLSDKTDLSIDCETGSVAWVDEFGNQRLCTLDGVMVEEPR